MVDAVNGVSSQVSDSSVMIEKLKDVKAKYEEVKDQQGIFGEVSNSIKCVTGIGASSKTCNAKAKDCENLLERYQNGEIDITSAMEAVQEFENAVNGFEKSQKNGSELTKNILTGLGSIAAATVVASGGPISWGLAAAVGAPIGAVLKTGLGVLDRATNKVEGDETSSKEVVKDFVSGSVTGMTSAVSSGIKSAKTLGGAIKNGVKCSATCGAISGSTSYLTDVALEEEKDFNLKDMAVATGTSALVSGAIGGVVGAGMNVGTSTEGGLVNIFENKVANTFGNKTTQIIIQDGATSTTRKVLNRATNDFMQYMSA